MRRLNDIVGYRDRKIYQDDFCSFSLDSLLLASFVKIKHKSDVVVDLCTGNAIIPLVLSKFYFNKMYGIELVKDVYDLAVASIKYNKLSDQIKIYNDDVLNASKYFLNNSVDVIVCNPPYYQSDSLLSKDKNRSIARADIYFDYANVFDIVSKILRNKGCLYMIIPVFRLQEILYFSYASNVCAKEMRFICSKVGKPARAVLMKFVKNSSLGVKIFENLYVYDGEQYSLEVLKIINGGV